MNREPSNDSLIGKTLAHFRIDKLLGRGGMAKVYYGWDTTLHRPVAVKVIDERYWGDPTYIYRFVREARAIAALQHANILSVYHADEQNGIPYFVMEYIQGIDLGQLIRQYARDGKLLPQDEVIRIGKAVAAALDFAHSRGFIHRDVKPSNVLIADSGRIVLADFGLALKVAQGTMGEVFGSPHYIAPEQVRSSSNAVPQSDLYSLGVMLYEMLTGALPFDDPSPAALAYQHVNQEPPPPRKINPNLNRSTEAVLLKALRKNPKERYLSGQALMEALEKALHRMGSRTSASLPQPFLPEPPHAEALPETMPMPEVEPVPVTSAEPLPQETYGAPGNGYADGPFTAPILVQPSRRVRPRSRPGGNRYILGCAGLLLLGLVMAAVILSIARGMPGFAFFPTATRTVAARPSATRTPKPSATPPPSATPAPTSTETPTDAPTVTPTTAPTGTPEPGTVRDISLDLMRQGEDGLFVINRGQEDFPVGYFWLGNHINQVSGTQWNIDTLHPGECVVVLKDKPNTDMPQDINCTRVGKLVRLDKKSIFWLSPYDVYFNNQQVTTCQVVQDTCSLSFRIIQ